MRMRWAICLAAVLFMPAPWGCSDLENDTISFKIISTGSYTAYYVVDAKDARPAALAINMGTLFSSETEVGDDFDSVQITATRTASTNTLSIIVYKDDTKVKETTLDTNTTVNTVTLEYEYGEEKSDSSSSSSSSSSN